MTLPTVSPRQFLRALWGGLAVLFIALPAGCGKRSHEAPQGGARIPPAKVRLKRNIELTQVRQEKMASVVETVGYIDAENQTEIAAGASGVIEEVLFREGDWVVKDQTVLVRIEPRRYAAMLAQAQANLARARANVEKMKAQCKRADAALRDAEQTLDLRRVLLDNIRRSGRGSKVEEKQEATAMVEVAAARFDVAKSEKEVCAADLHAAVKDVEAAQALADLAQHNWQRSHVRAPFTGQINQRKVTRGMHVEDKSVIATMADLTRLRLVGYIPQKAAPMVKQMLEDERRAHTAFLAGNAVAGPWTLLAAVVVDRAGVAPAAYRLEFELRALPEAKFFGRIFYLSTVADPSTGLFECKAEVPSRGLNGVLRPGFSAKVKCPLPGRPTSLVIPEECVRASEKGFIAFLPRRETGPTGEPEFYAQALELELGQRRPGLVEVLSARLHGKPYSLKGGDWLVQKGAEALEENTPLNIPKDKLAALLSPR